MKGKIKLIYIASNGRSGSTLLDMLLGKHKNCWTLGEFQMMPIDFKHDTQPCGCGSKISVCELWGEVYKHNQIIIESGIIDRFRDFGAGKVLRWNELKEICLNINSPCDKEINIYGKENYHILNTLYKQLEDDNIMYFVDASKDPYRLKWLVQSGFFDIKVLHIVKKPEAFVYSMTRGNDNHLSKIYMTIKMSTRWVIENSVIRKVVNKYIEQGDYCKVKYESLAGECDNTIGDIFNFLELPLEYVCKGGFSHKNHAVSGNAMRFKKSEIVLDEKWIKQMPTPYKAIVLIITTPLSFILNSVIR